MYTESKLSLRDRMVSAQESLKLFFRFQESLKLSICLLSCAIRLGLEWFGVIVSFWIAILGTHRNQSMPPARLRNDFHAHRYPSRLRLRQ